MWQNDFLLSEDDDEDVLDFDIPITDPLEIELEHNESDSVSASDISSKLFCF